MGDGPVLLAIRRAALAVYTATGEHPNALFLDSATFGELIDEVAGVETDADGRPTIAGMVILMAASMGTRPWRIVMPIHTAFGVVIMPQARPGAAA